MDETEPTITLDFRRPSFHHMKLDVTVATGTGTGDGEIADWLVNSLIEADADSVRIHYAQGGMGHSLLATSAGATVLAAGNYSAYGWVGHGG